MKSTVSLMSLVTLITLYGCTNPINMYTAQKYHDAGSAAERAGDYKLAHENYYRSYVNTEIGNADDQRRALAMYNLGRMKGYLCLKTEAESLLLQSVALEEKAPHRNENWYAGRLVETARFYLGFKEAAKAVPYFEKAASQLARLGVESTHPIDMANMWDDYANALRQTGAAAKADELTRRARQLRDSNPGKTAQFPPVSYGKNCNISS